MATKKTTTKKTAKTAAADAATSSRATKTEIRQMVSAAAEKKSGGNKRAAATKTGQGGSSPEALLARAEADMTRLLESLNCQMTAAMHAFEELAAIHRGRNGVITRTRPIDRATAMFQRLVSDVMDDRFAEVLPTLVALRVEMNDRAKTHGDGDPESGEFLTRGTEMLDQVLASAEVQAFDPKIGDAYDPLIHLAVGETDRSDLAGDVVSQVLQKGFRTARGKVIHAARVKVNRR